MKTPTPKEYKDLSGIQEFRVPERSSPDVFGPNDQTPPDTRWLMQRVSDIGQDSTWHTRVIPDVIEDQRRIDGQSIWALKRIEALMLDNEALTKRLSAVETQLNDPDAFFKAFKEAQVRKGDELLSRREKWSTLFRNAMYVAGFAFFTLYALVEVVSFVLDKQQ